MPGNLDSNAGVAIKSVASQWLYRIMKLSVLIKNGVPMLLVKQMSQVSVTIPCLVTCHFKDTPMADVTMI